MALIKSRSGIFARTFHLGLLLGTSLACAPTLPTPWKSAFVTRFVGIRAFYSRATSRRAIFERASSSVGYSAGPSYLTLYLRRKRRTCTRARTRLTCSSHTESVWLCVRERIKRERGKEARPPRRRKNRKSARKKVPARQGLCY